MRDVKMGICTAYPLVAYMYSNVSCQSPSSTCSSNYRYCSSPAAACNKWRRRRQLSALLPSQQRWSTYMPLKRGWWQTSLAEVPTMSIASLAWDAQPRTAARGVAAKMKTTSHVASETEVECSLHSRSGLWGPLIRPIMRREAQYGSDERQYEHSGAHTCPAV